MLQQQVLAVVIPKRRKWSSVIFFSKGMHIRGHHGGGYDGSAETRRANALRAVSCSFFCFLVPFFFFFCCFPCTCHDLSRRTFQRPCMPSSRRILPNAFHV